VPQGYPNDLREMGSNVPWCWIAVMAPDGGMKARRETVYPMKFGLEP
jgi:hypothetical protein